MCIPHPPRLKLYPHICPLFYQISTNLKHIKKEKHFLQETSCSHLIVNSVQPQPELSYHCLEPWGYIRYCYIRSEDVIIRAGLCRKVAVGVQPDLLEDEPRGGFSPG